MQRFLHRLWRLVHALAPRLAAPGTPLPAPLSADDRELHRRTHETIRRVSDDVVERLHFNTAVAAVMELVNALGEASGQTSPAVLREAIDATLLLLAPFVPHIASELWEAAGHARALDAERWPAADPGALARELIELPVQVNGKLRGRLTLRPTRASSRRWPRRSPTRTSRHTWLGGRSARWYSCPAACST